MLSPEQFLKPQIPRKSASIILTFETLLEVLRGGISLICQCLLGARALRPIKERFEEDILSDGELTEASCDEIWNINKTRGLSPFFKLIDTGKPCVP